MEEVMIGKAIRMGRIVNPDTKRTVIVPMDHGVSEGPLPGITCIREAVARAARGGADAVVVHKGAAARECRKEGPGVGLIVHLSASTSLSGHPLAKTLVCSVEEAIRMGADGVSVHVNVGNQYDGAMLRDLGEAARAASEWGMPLLAMIYPRGEKISNEFDPKAVMHAARLGDELGADMVKVPYTGDPESFRKVVEGCDIPVVIAGGPKMESDEAILKMAAEAVSAGAAGLSIGRNVFQHPAPAVMVSALSMIVHKGASVEEAKGHLERGLSRMAA